MYDGVLTSVVHVTALVEVIWFLFEDVEHGSVVIVGVGGGVIVVVVERSCFCRFNGSVDARWYDDDDDEVFRIECAKFVGFVILSPPIVAEWTVLIVFANTCVSRSTTWPISSSIDWCFTKHCDSDCVVFRVVELEVIPIVFNVDDILKESIEEEQEQEQYE